MYNLEKTLNTGEGAFSLQTWSSKRTLKKNYSMQTFETLEVLPG